MKYNKVNLITLNAYDIIILGHTRLARTQIHIYKYKNNQLDNCENDIIVCYEYF